MITWVGVFLALGMSALFAAPHPAFEHAPLVTAKQAKQWAKETSSVEEWMTKLPELYRRHYTLMYETGSRHAATPANPRIILFGPDARLLIGISTLPSDPLIDTVEMIEYQPSTATYAFSTLDFKRPKNKRAMPQNSACISCHGTDLRPNWEPYDGWPGAYGSIHDTIEPASAEHRNFRELIKKRLENKRLAALGPDLLEGQAGKGEHDTFYTIQEGGGANSALSILLNFSNRERVARLLKESPEFPKYRRAITAALLECPQPIETFLPAELKFARSFDEVRDGTEKYLRRHLDAQTRRAFELRGSTYVSPEDDDGTTPRIDSYGMREAEVTRVARLRYLLEQREGEKVSMARWALPLDRHAYDFNDGNSGLENLIGHFVRWAYLPGEIIELGPEFTTMPFSISSYDPLKGVGKAEDVFALELFVLNKSNEETCRRLAN